MFSIQLHDSNFSGQSVQTIPGRDIHSALEISREYSKWVREQIDFHQFIENVDYVVSAVFGENPSGGRPSIEYYFTLGSAKHVALTSRSKKGKEYRQALIDMENRVSMISQSGQERPTELAAGIIQDYIRIAALLQVPTHMGLIQAQHAVKPLGVDLVPMLAQSPLMQGFSASDRMLEPTELAKALGFKSAQAMNKMLERVGLQARINDKWEVTDAGKALCVENAWTTANGKSGYNYKWNVEQVRELVEKYVNGMQDDDDYDEDVI